MTSWHFCCSLSYQCFITSEAENIVQWTVMLLGAFFLSAACFCRHSSGISKATSDVPHWHLQITRIFFLLCSFLCFHLSFKVGALPWADLICVCIEHPDCQKQIQMDTWGTQAQMHSKYTVKHVNSNVQWCVHLLEGQKNIFISVCVQGLC